MKSISESTANYMMDIVAYTVIQSYIQRGVEPDIDGIEQFTRKMFLEYCEIEGITDVEEDNHEEELTEDEEDDYFDYCDYDNEDEELPSEEEIQEIIKRLFKE